MDRLHIVALLHDTKIIHSCIKILAILFWLGLKNHEWCPQLSTIDSLEKVADFSAIVSAITAMICRLLIMVFCSLWSATYFSKSYLFFLPSLRVFCSFLSAYAACLAMWSGLRNCFWMSMSTAWFSSIPFYVSCLHKHPCLWRSSREYDTPRHCWS